MEQDMLSCRIAPRKHAWMSKLSGRGGNVDNVLVLPPLLLPPARLASGPWHMTGRLWFADPTLPAQRSSASRKAECAANWLHFNGVLPPSHLI